MRAVYAGVVAMLWSTGSMALLAQSGRPLDRIVDPLAGLTIEQTVAAALDKLPALRAARAAVAAAQARRTQAGLRPNPSVSAGWREEIGGMDRMNELSVTVPLDLFRRGARVALAESGIAVADAEARRAILAAELEVRSRYAAVLAATRRAEVASELESTAQRTYQLLAARVEEGAAPPLDRDLARVEFERMAARARAAWADAEGAILDLGRSMGLVAAGNLRVRGSLEALIADTDVVGLAAGEPAARIDARPDVQAADARIREREAGINRARSEGRWDLSMAAGYARMRSGFPFTAFDGGGRLRGIEATFHNVSLGAMVMVPLFNRNQGAVSEAIAERSLAEAEAAAARLTAASELARASIALRAALDVAERYRASILPQSVRNMETVTERYELGRGTLFDVLQARQQLLQVQDEYTEALRRAYDAYVAALGARGGLQR